MPGRTINMLDLVGDSPALDFANSVNSRIAVAHDYLGTYEDLLTWAEHAGALQPGDRRMVRAETRAAERPRVLRAAHRRREAIFRVFSAIAAGSQPPPGALRDVLRAYGEAVARSEPHPRPVGATLTWPVDDPLRPLRPIDYDAGRLLLSADVGLVKECPGCGWLFLDRSRNKRRRWCDMQVCGSRSKMRRYYRSRHAP